jgi:hypothetical protein
MCILVAVLRLYIRIHDNSRIPRILHCKSFSDLSFHATATCDLCNWADVLVATLFHLLAPFVRRLSEICIASSDVILK